MNERSKNFLENLRFRFKENYGMFTTIFLIGSRTILNDGFHGLEITIVTSENSSMRTHSKIL